MQQYRMAKCKVAPHKFLFYVATQIEKDQYTLIEQSAFLTVKICNILSKIGQIKRKKLGENKSKIDLSLNTI